jgi:hypothetical protein
MPDRTPGGGEQEPSRRGRWSPEMITAVAAVVIGVSAIFVSLYEANLVRQQQRASVWPHLEAGHGFDGVTFRILAENTGIGPSRVEQVVLRYDGEPFPDWSTFFERAGIPVRGYLQSQISGRTLLPGRPLDVLVVSDPDVTGAVNEHWARVNAEACYCSIFDECWITDFLEVRRPAGRCDLPEASLFRQ